MGDPVRLHEVVANLLTNALKFTPAGGSVLLETGPEGEQAVLRVSRHRAGHRARRTAAHLRPVLPRPRAAGVAGSGIGLTVVAELVRAHQGQLDVASPPGEGTQFTLTLPRA